MAVSYAAELIRWGIETSITPPNAEVAEVAQAIVAVVDSPRGHRPFRVHIDPARDGAEEVSEVADEVRLGFLRRIGLEDLIAFPLS